MRPQIDGPQINAETHRSSDERIVGSKDGSTPIVWAGAVRCVSAPVRLCLPQSRSSHFNSTVRLSVRLFYPAAKWGSLPAHTH